MGTDKQHYYPRTLLKHFANADNKFYVYIRLASKNKFGYMRYDKVCAARYTYEGTSENGGLDVDNKLEDELSSLEDKLGPIVDNILKTIKITRCCRPTVDINDEEIEFLYKYMIVQFFRTDRGRINFIRAADINYIPRKYPIDLQEIRDSKNEILEFNNEFKKEGKLEAILKIFKKPKSMHFHIVTGNFITSDNPVIGMNDWKQMYMPISQDYCLGFQADEYSCSDNIIINMEKEKNKYLNESQIETANYFVISKCKFDSYTKFYIKNRFSDPDWSKKSRHFE
ncbi:DUF4238 domain-containing protein [Gemella cuniculi]|uniref:DUF4238 domain-containing protein n=1 Tax=Gemella cuniculi TaxID=150240 RepID=UPI00041BB33F|nr:DUF4238 domain-containing protein [Gemella cuniculi]